jgi:large repetitive protein
VSKLLKVLLLGSVLTLAAAVPALAQVSVEGESFNKPSGVSVAGGNGYSGGKALRIFSEKAIATKQVTITETSNVLVRAQGGQAGGTPSLTIRVDGSGAGTQPITSSTLADYSYTGITLQPGTYTIGLKGVNVTNARAVYVDVVSFPALPDTTPPETTITEALQPGTNELQFRFTSSEPNSTFECRIVNLSETWELCTSPKVYTDLPDGEHTFQVRAIDSAGNIDPTPSELGPVTIDETPPTGSITSGPADGATVNTNHVEFGWEASDNIAVHTVGCGLTNGVTTINPDNTEYGVCFDESDQPGNHANPAVFNNLPDGEYTFQLSITDRGGNNLQVMRTFTVDTTP